MQSYVFISGKFHIVVGQNVSPVNSLRKLNKAQNENENKKTF